MVKREYKDCRIEVSSYSSGRKWRPIVVVSKQTGSYVQTTNLRTPSDWLFDTEQTSDEQGYQLGATWIERQGLGPEQRLKGISMWAGIVYGALLERHGTHILLNGGAQISLDDAAQCDFPVGTYLKVTYEEINGRKFARSISQSDSFHALDATP
jgi:hypothetical protein